MKLSLISVLVVLVGLTAAWPSSRESDQNNDDYSEAFDEEEEERTEEATTNAPEEETTTVTSVEVDTSAPDEAFLTGANRTFTFGQCSAYEGQSGQVERLLSRCGVPNYYFGNIVTWNLTVTKYFYSSSSCCDNCRPSTTTNTTVVEHCRLTCVKALDLKEGGSSKANVSIVEGGLGNHFIRIRVDGELGKGYYYLLQGFTNCTGVVWRPVPASSN